MCVCVCVCVCAYNIFANNLFYRKIKSVAKNMFFSRYPNYFRLWTAFV